MPEILQKKRLESAFETVLATTVFDLFTSTIKYGILKGPDHIFGNGKPSLYLQLMGKKISLAKL
ncbi:MAG: hypothetical protein IPF75_18425 [Bacteroidetes bacterium]|nr:hypothetical protein [Bacteroidota bacterium]